MDRTIYDACTQCGLCQEHCSFLHRYQLNLGDQEQLRKLAYHCFQCGRCSQVCPRGLDGRALIHQMRVKEVEENHGRVKEKGYGLLLWEKMHYKFRNYGGITPKTVLFPGCNFPSFYPRTNKALGRLLQSYGIGMVYDCCGKPVYELGLEDRARSILREMEERLSTAGVEELVVLCPNCYTYLKKGLKLSVISIYELFQRLDQSFSFDGGKVFLPCPDRETGILFSQIQSFCQNELEAVDDCQCCGLGGCAGAKEPDLVREMVHEIRDKMQQGRNPDKRQQEDSLLVYCASCAGSLSRQGIPARHVLSEMLGVCEQADWKHSLKNRAICRIKKQKKTEVRLYES